MGKDQNVAIGDVIKGDLSWTVYGYEERDEAFVLNQRKEIPNAKDFDPSKIRFDAMSYSGGKKTLPERVEEAGLQLVDKKFVVILTNNQGGGTGHGPHDIYPDGWYVTAQTLKDDGSFDPKGLKIQFYQTGCFTCMIPEPNVVGKMQQIFVPAEQIFVPVGP